MSDPNRMRPAWGATSSCTRCGKLITWKAAWKDVQTGDRICLARGTWGHHRSATAGTPQSWPPRLVPGERADQAAERLGVKEHFILGEMEDAAKGMFRDHACWKCGDGARPCVQGHPRRCEYPHARND